MTNKIKKCIYFKKEMWICFLILTLLGLLDYLFLIEGIHLLIGVSLGISLGVCLVHLFK